MLILVVIFPLLATLVVLSANSESLRLTRGSAVAMGLIEAALIVVAGIQDPATLGTERELAPSLDITLRFDAVGSSIAFALLAALGTLTIIASVDPRRVRPTATLLFPALSAALAALFSRDFLLYFGFQELLVPVFALLLVGWGSSMGLDTAKRYLGMTLLGSGGLLAAVAFLHFRQEAVSGENFEIALSGKEPWLLLIAFFLGFGVRLAIFPLHPWMARSQTELPFAVGTIVNAVLFPVAGFGLARHALPELGSLLGEIDEPLIFAGAFSALFAALAALAQERPKRLLAFLAMVQVSAAFTSLLTASPAGRSGAMVMLLAQGFGFTALIMLLAAFEKRRGQAARIGGGGPSRRLSPRGTLALWCATLLAIGFPGSLGFLGEFLIVFALIDTHPVAAIVLLVSFILGGWALIRAVRDLLRADGGALSTSSANRERSLDGLQWAVLFLLLIVNLAAGLFPSFFLRHMDPTVVESVTSLATGGGR